MRALAATAALLLVGGCMRDEALAPPPPLVHTATRADEEAWVRRAVPLLLGRAPSGLREVERWTDLVWAIGRDDAARTMMEEPEFVAHWLDVLIDLLGVPRRGMSGEAACYAAPAADDATARALSRFVAEHPPAEAFSAGAPNMNDLMRGSLLEDDLRPLLLGRLVNLATHPPAYCGNTPTELLDEARRRVVGERFTAIFLGRSVSCLACHNGEGSVSDRAEAALDRHWPMASGLERSVFGAPGGLGEEAASLPWRSYGVLSKEGLASSEEAARWPDESTPAIRPWGLANACGSLRPESALLDPLTGPTEIFLAGERSARTSVWEVERSLRAGFQSLSALPRPIEPDAAAATPEGALAWLVAARITDKVVGHITGSGLTLAHGFSRNAHQQQAHVALTRLFIEGGFRLRTLLAAALALPGLDAHPDADRCETEQGLLPPIYDPFVDDLLPESERSNGAGELVRPFDLRRARTIAQVQLGSAPPQFEFDDGLVQESALLEPPSAQGWSSSTMLRWVALAELWCAGNNGRGLAPWAQWLHERAVAHGATRRDVLLALKDRLHLETDVTADEEAIYTTIFGPLDAPYRGTPGAPTEAERQRLVEACTGLVSSAPMFLVGLPPPAAQTPSALLADDPADAVACARLAARAMASTRRSLVCDGARLLAR